MIGWAFLAGGISIMIYALATWPERQPAPAVVVPHDCLTLGFAWDDDTIAAVTIEELPPDLPYPIEEINVWSDGVNGWWVEFPKRQDDPVLTVTWGVNQGMEGMSWCRE